MRKPNFIIIGAQKSGTTWLWEKAKQHPDIFVPQQKELHFFNKGIINDERFETIYIPHFEGNDKYGLIGEATAGYFWSMDDTSPWCNPPHAYNDNIPGQIMKYLGPEVKLILSLRHPVQRAVSGFYHHYAHKSIPENAGLWDVAHTRGIVDMGFYYRHLIHWLQTFTLKDLLIFKFERDIKARPEWTMSLFFEYLGADQTIKLKGLNKPAFSGVKLINKNGTIRPANNRHGPVVTQEDLERLMELYYIDIQKLGLLLSWDISDWLAIPKIA